MRKLIHSILGPLEYTILHPQWQANRHQRQSLKVTEAIRNSHILDIGSGNADYHNNLSSDNTLVTLDYPDTNEWYRHCPVIYGTTNALPFTGNRFDYTFLLEVLEHIELDREAVGEAFRVLKPGGRLIVSVPFLYPSHDISYNFRRYTEYGLKSIPVQAGFSVISCRSKGNSLIASLQLLNLTLMEVTLKTLLAWKPLGLLVGLVTRPMTILINIASAPLIPINSLNVASLGHTAVAEKPVKG